MLSEQYDRQYSASRAAGSRSPATCSRACSRSGCSATSACIRKPLSWFSISASRRGAIGPRRRPAARRALSDPSQPRPSDRQLQSRLFPQPRQAQRDRRRRPWRAARPTCSCSKATCAAAILQDPVAAMSFAFFAEAVAEAGRDLAIAQASNGDSALWSIESARARDRRTEPPRAAAARPIKRPPLRRRRRFHRDRGRGGATPRRARGLPFWSPHASSRTRRRVRSWSPVSSSRPCAISYSAGGRAHDRSSRTVPLLRESDGRFDLAKPAARRRCCAACGCWMGRHRLDDARCRQHAAVWRPG